MALGDVEYHMLVHLRGTLGRQVDSVLMDSLVKDAFPNHRTWQVVCREPNGPEHMGQIYLILASGTNDANVAALANNIKTTCKTQVDVAKRASSITNYIPVI